MRLYHGVIKRRVLPYGVLRVTVSTRLGWYQRTPLRLFSPQLEDHLLAIGAAERTRIGLHRHFYVEARGEDADSWQRLTWQSGSLTPYVDEVQEVDPPFDTHD